MSILTSCIQNRLSSDEYDDVYFNKKDIIKIEEDNEIDKLEKGVNYIEQNN